MIDRASPTPFLYAQRVLLQLQAVGSLLKGVPISIDDVVQAVTSISGVVEIRFRFVDVESTSVMAIFQRFEREPTAGQGDIAEIVINSRLDLKTQRFAACKEICQVFLSDLRSSRSADADEVSAYLYGLLDSSLLRPFSPALQTDQFATVCAVEILCPFFIRDQHYAEFLSGRMTSQQLAEMFGVPEQIASLAFSRRYHENARQSILAERSAEFRLNPRSLSLSSDLQIMFQRNVEEALRENETLGHTAQPAK